MNAKDTNTRTLCGDLKAPEMQVRSRDENLKEYVSFRIRVEAELFNKSSASRSYPPPMR